MKIAILATSNSAPGAQSLAKAAQSLGVKADIISVRDVADTNVFDEYDTFIVRIGPATYPLYYDLVKLDLHKTSITPALPSASISQFSVEGGAKASSPQEEQTSGSLLDEPEMARSSRMSSKSVPDKLRKVIENTLMAFDKNSSNTIMQNLSIPMPRTSVMTREQNRSQELPLIMKAVTSNQGKGVFLAKNESEYEKIRRDMLMNDSCYIEQEFIAESKGADIRLFVVGDKVVAAMARRASSNDEFRSNIHQGGSAAVYVPSDQECELAVSATKAFKLVFAGVDIVKSQRGPLVLEVNPSPGFAIAEVCAVDIARKVIEQYTSEYKRLEQK